MIPIAGVYIHIRESFLQEDYQALGEKIYEYIHSLEKDILPDIEKGIEVRIEEGSTKVWAIVLTLTNVFIHYGSIRQSVDYVLKDASYINNKVNSYIKDAWDIDKQDIIYERKETGVPGQIKELFRKVDNKVLTPEEATAKALAIIKKHTSQVEEGAVKKISIKLHKELAVAAELALPTIREKQTQQKQVEATEVVSRRSLPKSQIPASLPQPIVQDLLRPRGLVIRKRPQETRPTFEFY